MKYDVIIKNGNVIELSNNTDRPWIKKDIGIKNNRIINIGNLDNEQAEEIVDATGLIVCPGFIDIHSHSDVYLIENPKAESKIRQGVTTEVTGNCGMSAAPLGSGYRPSKSIIRDDVEINWNTTAQYLKQVEENGTSVNLVPLVGHGNIRGTVKGYTEGEPSPEELSEMKELLKEAFAAGVWGMTSGLVYPPGSLADDKELTELCKIVEEEGGVYHTHIRGQGDRLLSATMEALKIAQKTGVSLHILHHKGMGDSNAAKVKFTLPMIDDYLADGMDITMDMYPYLAGQGGLAMFLPQWVHEGGPEKLVQRLKNQELRKKIKLQMVEPELVYGYQSYARELGWQSCWENVLICDASSEKKQDIVGKSIAEAKPDHKDPIEYVFDLLIEEGGDLPVVIPDMIDEDDKYMQMVLRHPMTMFGSDGYALAPYGVLGGGTPHPRSYGSFPRVLGRYVRKKRLFTWKEAIRKMTYLPAKYLGLEDRGMIGKDKYADIVIFNPKTVIDRATFTDPHQYPDGIEYVLVNGKIVIHQGEHTSKLPGQILKSN